MRRFLLCAILATAVVSPATAQYPDKAIRFIVPQAAGSNTDLYSRLIAAEMGKALGQQIVIENKPGAAFIVGLDAIAKAPPDGYTIGMGLIGGLAIAPHMVAKLPYNIEKDFQPVAQVSRAYMILAVSPKSPLNSVKDIIAYAKANPGKLNYASAGKASPGHLTAEFFARRSGAAFTHVPYKGNAEAIRSVLAGETQMMFTPTTGALPHVKAGRLKVIAVYLTERIDELPGVPSLEGFDQKTLPFWYGLLVPAGTPREIVLRLNAEAVKALKDPQVDKTLRAGRIFPIGNSPEAFGAMMREGHAAWGRVIRETGVKGE
jgi:tripartite-type tricarboxylate transporter receptor subunit TctC